VIRIICGPTAAGKSGLAMRLAEERGLTIISADSRQIYREFDIGTAKPSRAELERVPHRCIDVADPEERWSAHRWANDAAAAIEELGEDRVLVVGGTGLYLNALVHPLAEQPELDEERRELVAKEIGTWSVERLREWTRTLDPARADLGRTQLLRAVETVLLTGRRISEFISSVEGKKPDRPARWLVIDPGDALHAQIEGRLDAMLAGGWIDEAGSLAARHAEDAPAWKACGYRVARSIARGEETVEQGRQGILVHTRQYAKRQRTWFRHQLSSEAVTRLDPRDPRADAIVRAWWASEETA
jgi:tRNA dimethylallyltransferase